MEKTAKNTKQPLSPIAHLVLFGASLGLSYAAASRAIDTGSLLDYTAALILFVLAVRNAVQAYQLRKARKK